ncbi:MAG: zinc ribbon domain-containing protein [Gemmatimonadaceae bacterium]
MSVELQALLALQAHDAEIRELERRRAALEPRLLDLQRRRQLAADAAARARLGVEGEERRLREMQGRVAEHRQLHERNLAQLDVVRRTREANAAISQVEQARRILADEESDVQGITRRLQELRQGAELQEQTLAEVERAQQAEREQIGAEEAAIEGELAAARAERERAAELVPRTLRGQYERIAARRRGRAVFPLRGPSCANCDTALPLQRRSVMARTGSIELCESCGVLLYAAE